MPFFRRKKSEEEEDLEEDELEEKSSSRKSFKDLRPENKKKRKEPLKPWGRKERIIVLSTLLVTASVAAFLTISSEGFTLPKFPKISLPEWGSGTITIEGTKEQRDKADKIKLAFEEKISKLSGTYGFYVIDLSNGFGFGEREGEIFQSASFNKLQVLATIFKEVENGSLDLSTTHTLVNSDKQGGAGELSQKPEGTVITLEELARLMGNGSDNTALYIAQNEVGGVEKIERVTKEIGMENTSFSENQTTPKDVGIFFKKLWRDEIVSEKYKTEILDFLTNTVREDLIPQGVPKQVRVSHKYGMIDSVVNDAGIIFADKPYILVIMSKDADLGEAQTAISEISKVVYDGMTK
ncbi:class A beta-lactamase-related serine hydrolase [Patescibacteria group bacterium]|nr:class A beta-lactamase-related serine hydrolase [Patescibacteria group bacterium]